MSICTHIEDNTLSSIVPACCYFDIYSSKVFRDKAQQVDSHLSGKLASGAVPLVEATESSGSERSKLAMVARVTVRSNTTSASGRSVHLLGGNRTGSIRAHGNEMHPPVYGVLATEARGPIRFTTTIRNA